MPLKNSIGSLLAALVAALALPLPVSAQTRPTVMPAPAQFLSQTQSQAEKDAEALALSQTNAAAAKTQWQSSVSAGLTLTRGNSDAMLATMTESSVVKWGRNRLSLGGDGAFGETKAPGATNSTINAETAHGFLQYDRLFTPRFYGYSRVDGLHDGVADILYRVSLSPGLGYYFIKTTNTGLSAEAGPGFILEKLDGTTENYASFRLGEQFHRALSRRARLWESVEWLPEAEPAQQLLPERRNRHRSGFVRRQETHAAQLFAG